MPVVRVEGSLPYYLRRMQNNSSAKVEIRKITLQDDVWMWEEEPKTRTIEIESSAAKMIKTKMNELKTVKTTPAMFRKIFVEVITAIEEEKTKEQHVEESLQEELAEAPALIQEEEARVAES
ncbi:unnamed protein product [Amoebophrya sp. A25]|nr:unnamed protein product [Amoebophrya sp. A25]|eukprot:GSA25T00015595001.1